MRMKSALGLLVAAISIGAMLSCTSSSGGATGTGFVWIATEGDQQVRAFNINLSSGSVSQVGSARATGAQPSAIAAHKHVCKNAEDDAQHQQDH